MFFAFLCLLTKLPFSRNLEKYCIENDFHKKLGRFRKSSRKAVFGQSYEGKFNREFRPLVLNEKLPEPVSKINFLHVFD